MKALVFAAGLGTRLQPLTNTIPKALVPIKGKTLLQYSIEYLIKNGVTEIIINVHHFANQIIEFVQKNDFGIPISISDESQELLNTGGGLLYAKDFFNSQESFIVYNVDIVCSIDLKKAIEYHNNTQALATLLVSDRKTARYLLFDNENTLCGWRNVSDDKEIIKRKKDSYKVLAFSGIQILHPSIFNKITQKGVFPIIDMYLSLAQDNIIKGYEHTNDFWLDVGKFNELSKVEDLIEKNSTYFI